MNFKQAFKEEGNKTVTANGDLAYKSTKNAITDMFGAIGSLRKDFYYDSSNVIMDRALELFNNAYDISPEYAMKILFYTRDCRGGMGEKETFKIIATRLLDDDNKCHLILNNLKYVVEFGSYKDLVDLFLRTSNEYSKNKIIAYMSNIIYNDCQILYNKAKSISELSLIGKWLPTINSKSAHTKNKAKEFIKYLYIHFPPLNYRLFCRDSRRALNIVERDIASKQYENIEYNHVPSRCMLLNNHLFNKYDKERFDQYMEDVKNGKAEIKSSVLFPSDITKKYLDYIDGFYWNKNNININDVYEEQWKALPNYIDKPINMIPFIDTSGSMCGTPMNVSTALGIYLAERNPSEEFQNLILEFGADAHLYDISNKKTLLDKLRGYNQDCENTNLKKAFKKLLNIGIQNNLPNEDMPKAIVIISDMQFDYCQNDSLNTVQEARKVWEEKGYTFPNIIYWNVNDNNNFPEVAHDGIAFVSGYSPAIMQAVLNSEILTPMEVVDRAIMIDRYKDIFWDLRGKDDE